MPFKGLSPASTATGANSLQDIIRKLQKVELNVVIYDESSYIEQQCVDITDILSVIQNNYPTKCVWIDVTGPMEQRYDIVHQLGFRFGLHVLTLEDIQTTEERIKLDIFDDGVFLLMKMIYLSGHSNTNIQHQQISFYLKENLLLTFQEKRTLLFASIKHRLVNHRGRLTKLHSDYLFYSLVDNVVENYMIVLDMIGLKIAEIDSELMTMKSHAIDTLKLIYNMKHDMLHLRIICAPLKDILIKLQKARDRLPRRDLFAVRRRGPRPLSRKRGRPIKQRVSASIDLPRQLRRHSSLPTQTAARQSTLLRGQSVSPTRIDIVQRRKSRRPLSNSGATILHDYIFMYLKDLNDHIWQMQDTIETHCEMISGLINFYMLSNGNAAQQTMKLLTMINAVFYPMMFIHGLNSMNFVSAPQRGNDNSYFIVLGVYALIALAMTTLFTVKKWFQRT